MTTYWVYCWVDNQRFDYGFGNDQVTAEGFYHRSRLASPRWYSKVQLAKVVSTVIMGE